MVEVQKKLEKNNVTLIQTTYEYYQAELTRMLKNECYGEAIALLQFLLKCDGKNEQTRTEWNALLQWLLSAFPEAEHSTQYLGIPSGTAAAPLTDFLEEEWEGKLERSEQDILRSRFQKKLHADGEYMERLFSSLTKEGMNDRKLLILELLAVAEDPEIDQALLKLLTGQPLDSLLQFSVLQVMRRRGMSGKIQFPFCGQDWLTVQIENTPLDYASFPSATKAPAVRVSEVTSTCAPSLVYFAQEMWKQYLKHIYGSVTYYQLCKGGEQESVAWSAALHLIVSQMLYRDEMDGEADVKQLYGITDDMQINYELALRSLNQSLIRKGDNKLEIFSCNME